jgi:hypothetical protein
MTRKEVSFRLWAGGARQLLYQEGIALRTRKWLVFQFEYGRDGCFMCFRSESVRKETHGGSVLEIMILCMHAIPQVLQPLLLLLLLLLLKCSSYPNQHTP